MITREGYDSPDLLAGLDDPCGQLYSCFPWVFLAVAQDLAQQCRGQLAAFLVKKLSANQAHGSLW